MTIARVIDRLTDLTGAAVIGQRVVVDSTGVTKWRDAEAVNVREYGIVGDGSDETTKINALLAAVASRSVRRTRVFFPEPTGDTNGSNNFYKITAPIAAGQDLISIEGAGRARTIIRQYGGNQPIMLWDDEGSSGKSLIRVSGLSLEYPNPVANTDTQSFGIQFRSDAAGTKISNLGYFLMDFADLTIKNSYVGIGEYGSGSGTCPIWSTTFRNIQFRDTLMTPIQLTTLAGTVGQPHNTLDHIDVLNYNTGVQSLGPAIKGAGLTGLAINHLNVEDWCNQILDLEGGTYAVVNGLRTERHKLTSADNSLIYLDGQFVFNGVDLSSLYVQFSSGVVTIFNAATATSKLTVNGVKVARNSVGSTQTKEVAILWGTAGAEIYADGVLDNPSNLIKTMQASGFGTGLYAVVRVNGMPPIWDALPSASATYRGRAAQLQGGTGVADVEYRCLKSAADAYAWKAVVTG